MERGNGAALGNGHLADDGCRRPVDDNAALGTEDAWLLVLELRRLLDDGTLARSTGRELGFALAGDGGRARPCGPSVAEVLIDPDRAVMVRSRRAVDAGARDVLELHLAQALRPRAEGYTVAILGQSLDGFIATRHGHSRYINGDASLTHLHRLRALSDAVVIGVSTAIADCPRLTTRHVPGPHATRVVIDPRGRLPAGSGLLHDGAAQTLIVRGTEGGTFEEPLAPRATILHLPWDGAGIEPARIVAALAARGLTRLLVEGGGVTVGRFLEAGLLDRLQLAVSPLIIGAGRPALPVAPVERLDEALRPPCRRHVMGEDVLFDLCLRPPATGGRAQGLKAPGPSW